MAGNYDYRQANTIMRSHLKQAINLDLSIRLTGFSGRGHPSSFRKDVMEITIVQITLWQLKIYTHFYGGYDGSEGYKKTYQFTQTYLVNPSLPIMI